jgi:general nucleoside transport system ATP-binding protein
VSVARVTGPASLQLTGIEKRFGAIVADRGASLDVAAGEIHALVGENGAGKSTLMRIACGLTIPDAGRVEFEGRDVTGWGVRDAIAAGIGMVHQHFMLVPTLTVAENVVLGDEPQGRPFDQVVSAFAEKVGLEVPVSRRMGSCSVGEAQRVEILKVLYRGARVLILDEPTAVLTPPEVERLWEVLRAHRAGGGTVVLITHKLDEVMAVSDRVTVMRGGRTVASMPTLEATVGELVRAMVGREIDVGNGSPLVAQEIHAGAPVLDVEGVCSVRAGEILGIAGVEGNGQTELIETIAGLRDGHMVVRVAGERVDLLSVRARRELGVRHIPEDRQRRGLVLDFSIADNLSLGTAPGWASGAIREFDIRPTDPRTPVRALSGGNQQKVVVAREMAVDRPYAVLLAAHPTRGVDVGAVEIIHRHLRAARAAGRAIVLVSTELTELIALSDRIAVMLRGRFVAVLPRGEATVERIGALMSGAAAA